jgi:hypothetical protein
MANRVTFKKDYVQRQEEGEDNEGGSPNTHAAEVGENRDRIDSLENEDSFEEKKGEDA